MRAIPLKAFPWRVRIALVIKSALNVVAGPVAVLLLRLIRRADPDRTSDALAALMRRIGRFLPEHRTGRANLAAAYPDKSPAEIEAILTVVWENLGRAAAEYAHLDRLWDFDLDNRDAGRIEIPVETTERFDRLRDDGKPALIFASHLGNWELPAVAAAAHGLDAALLYRAPSVGDVASAVQAIRATKMGLLIPTGIGAPVAAAAALDRGLHVGMLVDQYSYRGVEVTFFGRRCRANTDAGAARPPLRLPDPRHARGAIAGAPFPHRAQRADRAAARWQRRHRRRRDDPDDCDDRRGLGARAPRAVAVAAPAVEVIRHRRACPGDLDS